MIINFAMPPQTRRGASVDPTRGNDEDADTRGQVTREARIIEVEEDPGEVRRGGDPEVAEGRSATMGGRHSGESETQSQGKDKGEDPGSGLSGRGKGQVQGASVEDDLYGQSDDLVDSSSAEEPEWDLLDEAELAFLEQQEQKRSKRRERQIKEKKKATVTATIERVKALRAANKALDRTAAGLSVHPRQRRLDQEVHRIIAGAAEEPLRGLEDAGRNTLPRRGTFKLQPLPTFEAKSIREVDAFESQALRQFRLDAGGTLPTDLAKIDFCVLWFNAKNTEKWDRYEKEVGRHRLTWDMMVTQMKNMVVTEENRPHHFAKRYEKARQRPGESVDDFASYLDSLERELGLTSDFTRRLMLYAKLEPELQDRIDNHADLPRTRAQLVTLATRLQQTNRIGESKADKYGQGHKRQLSGSAESQDKKKSRLSNIQKKGSASNSPGTGSNAIPDRTASGVGLRCRQCNTNDHSFKECPVRRCYRCQGLGHIASECTSSSGKETAH